MIVGALLLLARVLFAIAFLFVLLFPAWWLAGRIQSTDADAPGAIDDIAPTRGSKETEEILLAGDTLITGATEVAEVADTIGTSIRSSPFFRFLAAVGLALVGYLSIVNLIGRATGNSIVAVWICLGLNAVASGVLLLRSRPDLDLRPLALSWRVWVGPLALAVMFGLPQWLLAVSTNYWDEAVASGIYLTAPSQFVEGLFPPRHNAFPDIPIKYHYGFTILSGTLMWLSGLSANVSTDVVSTCLWLFTFLFVYFWLRHLDFDTLPSIWGSVATLLGGGLSWLYIGRLEAYRMGGYVKVPNVSDITHRYDAMRTWVSNIMEAAITPSHHLRNADGSLSNLPWDVAGQFQQHATATGIALTALALYLLITWQKRKELHIPLLLANIATFSVLILGHAVFGTMALGTAGICLLWAWLQDRSRVSFFKGLWFGVGVLLLAPLHGGMLAVGGEYGTAGAFSTFRRGFGYAAGGLSGFVHWNIAGFGLPLLLSLVAVLLFRRRRDALGRQRQLVFTALAVFAAISYMIPQVMFYSSESIGVEEFTEISKFFFCTHFGLALLSVFAIAALGRFVQLPLVVTAVVMSAITPVAFCYVQSVDATGKWIGFYHSPYEAAGGTSNVEVQMGVVLRGLRRTNRDTYFDASGDEGTHGYLSGLLIYGGSVFTLTPRRFERNGTGFRLSEEVVAKRLAQSSRMSRLAPGAPEESGTTWYYARPDQDLALAPVIVRSRFAKLVREGYFVKKHEVGARVLYSIEKPTKDLDSEIEKYWEPRVVSQTKTDWNGDAVSDLLFYDLLNTTLRINDQSVGFPTILNGQGTPLISAGFPGDARVDLLVGRMGDTVYKRGKRLDDVQEYNPWLWSYRSSDTGQWQSEYERWLWDRDTPLVADLNHDGVARHIAYRHRTGEWLEAPNRIISGPAVDENELPLPFAGRFLPGSTSDLGLWSLKTGMVSLRSIANGQIASFPLGDPSGDILVPGDYDGMGYDQLAIWQRSTRTWRWWLRGASGPVSEVVFGTETGIPVPWDYNHDGTLDLAYWEPANGKILVSFNRGRTVDLTVTVPPHCIPAFVNMY